MKKSGRNRQNETPHRKTRRKNIGSKIRHTKFHKKLCRRFHILLQPTTIHG